MRNGDSGHSPARTRAEEPGLGGYGYGVDIGAAEGGSPYFFVFEGEFDDAAAMESTEGEAALADLANCAAGGRRARRHLGHRAVLASLRRGFSL